MSEDILGYVLGIPCLRYLLSSEIYSKGLKIIQYTIKSYYNNRFQGNTLDKTIRLELKDFYVILEYNFVWNNEDIRRLMLVFSTRLYILRYDNIGQSQFDTILVPSRLHRLPYHQPLLDIFRKHR